VIKLVVFSPEWLCNPAAKQLLKCFGKTWVPDIMQQFSQNLLSTSDPALLHVFKHQPPLQFWISIFLSTIIIASHHHTAFDHYVPS